VGGIDIQKGTSWGSIRHSIMSCIPSDARHHLSRNPLPALINCYQRAYFRSQKNDIRITLDSALIFHRQKGVSPNYTRKIALPDISVLEIKFPLNSRNNVLDVMSGFPFPVTRFSKYCVGILATA
jgi:hypothetical protein